VNIPTEHDDCFWPAAVISINPPHPARGDRAEFARRQSGRKGGKRSRCRPDPTWRNEREKRDCDPQIPLLIGVKLISGDSQDCVRIGCTAKKQNPEERHSPGWPCSITHVTSLLVSCFQNDERRARRAPSADTGNLGDLAFLLELQSCPTRR